MLSHLTLAATLLCLPAVVHSQVNIERLRRTDPGAGLSGTAGGSITARTGNVRLVLVTLDARLDYNRPRWMAFGLGSTGLGWQGGRRFSNAGLLHVRYNYRLRPVAAAEVFTQVDYDKSRLLSFRFLAGAGPRITIARDSTWDLAAGTAYMLEHERIDLPAGAVHPRRTTWSRWSNYLTASFGEGERVAVVGTVYVQPYLADFGDVRVLGDARLAVQLVGSVSLAVSSHVRYDSRPPDGIRPVDAVLTTGLTVEW